MSWKLKLVDIRLAIVKSYIVCIVSFQKQPSENDSWEKFSQVWISPLQFTFFSFFLSLAITRDSAKHLGLHGAPRKDASAFGWGQLACEAIVDIW